MNKDSKELWKFLYNRFTIPIIIGAVIAGLAYLNKLGVLKEILPEIVILVLVTIIVSHFSIIKDSFKIFILKNRLEKADDVYKDLIDAHIHLPHIYPRFIDDRISEDATQNGLIFINVIDDDYTKWLKKCAENAKKSFCSTLSYPYLPSVFFQENGKHLKYLEDINNIVKNIKDKKRIYIFKKEDFVKDLESLKLESIISFFTNQSQFEIYFLDKKKFLDNHISNYSDIHIAIISDFALFDNSLAFRRIGSLELAYYFTNAEAKTLPCSFRKLFENDILKKDCFHKLNLDKLIAKTEEVEIINEIKNQINYNENTTS